jgi:transcription elongation factor Elf1
MYNELRSEFACPHCGRTGTVDVQLTYGNLYGHVYEVGDAIIWGRTQVGDRAEKRVAVEGIGACGTCGAECLFDILVEAGIISSVRVSTGEHDYRHGEGHYVILR